MERHGDIEKIIVPDMKSRYWRLARPPGDDVLPALTSRSDNEDRLMSNLRHPDFCSRRAGLTDAARQLSPGHARSAAGRPIIPADVMDEVTGGQAAEDRRS